MLRGFPVIRQFGEMPGDMVLKELASLIKRNMRRSDIVARVGGDEFAIILPETPIEVGVKTAEKLRRIIGETPLSIMTGEIMVKMSLGVAEYPGNADNVKDILIASDVALYRAKQGGRDRVEMIEVGEREVRMEIISKGEALKKAIEEDRIEAFFQPIIELATERVFGLDCLARVREEKGYLLPEEFRQTADGMGYIDRIDTIVIEKGLSAYKGFMERYGRDEPPRLFFNSSAKMFLSDTLVEDILEMSKRHGVPPGLIVFQITEGETLPHITMFMELIGRLKGHGIGFSLKKFGSGFSSFMYLRYLEVAYVKIDGEFIRNIAGDRQKRILITNMHRMLVDLNIKDIAEHVEDGETSSILKEIGVNYAQGIYYGGPARL